ncbi:rhodanese-like domain-containing protein [Niabella soli]|uniref:Rhodanese domain-containing protein n=1 Tax=Niabella soli DSM 19437 TaxID=929713 RepID=W0F2C7_9BACT|nr:rhodanese-like domain-containing protein [Niabella soli]AHF17180.1 hypothetical protein NIASO_03120 [Niabella soli DSM 19437]
MKKGALLLLLIVFLNAKNTSAQLPKTKVDFDGYETLLKLVKLHRKTRLVNLDVFLKLSKQTGTIILDTRSGEMYDRKHIAGAVHLDFSDFTQDNLAGIIPSANTRVLIYCNNNIEGDPEHFPANNIRFKNVRGKTSPYALALNIPTYIGLYGYGYTNVFELAELINDSDGRLRYEGTDVNPNEPSITGAVIMTKR